MLHWINVIFQGRKKLNTIFLKCISIKCSVKKLLIELNELHGWLRQWRVCLQCGRLGFDPWVGKIPWRRARLPTPVFLPGESPWTEKPCGLQSTVSQSWTQLRNSEQSLLMTLFSKPSSGIHKMKGDVSNFSSVQSLSYVRLFATPWL